MPILKNNTRNVFKNQPQSIKDLGVDLKITADGDLELNNLADISMVSGIENLSQATAIKLNTEAGSNRYHTSLGIENVIGQKTTNPLVLKLSLIKALRQDERYSNVSVDVQVEGNTYLVDIRLTVKNSGVTIPLQFTVLN